jgi:F-type H+-transporting ATPase subunit epsilon
LNGFALNLLDPGQSERIEGVASFVGEDATGSFGILSGHARFMTVLSFGLARFREIDGPWQYLAVPGALLYFVDDMLYITTRYYLRDMDFERISRVLEERTVAEERELRAVKESLRCMEEELFRRMWELRHSQ